MRRLILGLALVLALVAPVQAADPIEGKWVTTKGVIIAISACNARFCLRALSGQYAGKNMGTVKLVGNHYSGEIVNPQGGESVTARLVLKGNKLSVNGCLGSICATNTWTRQ